MQLTLRDDLPFVRIGLTYAGNEIEVDDVLVDTGSATTVLGAHVVAAVGIQSETEDNEARVLTSTPRCEYSNDAALHEN